MTLPSLRTVSLCGLKYGDYALWSREIFPGGANLKGRLYCEVSQQATVITLWAGEQSGRRGARQSRVSYSPPSHRTAAGGATDAGSLVCTSPEGVRPPWEHVSRLLSAGDRHVYSTLSI